MNNGKIDEFFKKKLITNYNTKKSYRTNINKYFNLINKDIDTYFQQTPEETEEDLENAFDLLRNKQKKELLVIKTIFNGVKQFLCKMDKRLKQLDFWDTLKDRTRDAAPTTDDDVPNAQDIKKVLQHGNTRARAMFLIQSCTGCRIGELIAFSSEDIFLDEHPVRVRFKKSYDPTQPNKTKPFVKNNKKRNSFLTDEATEVYKAYMKERDILFKKAIKKTRAEYRPVELTGDKDKDEEILVEYVKGDKRVFPMSDDQARDIWARMVIKSGFYKKDSNTNRLTLHPHCLRKFMRSYLGNSDLAEHIMGHAQGMTKHYRDKKPEDVGKEFLEYAQNVTIFEAQPDLTDIHQQLTEKDKEIAKLNKRIDRLSDELGLRVLEKLKELETGGR